MKKPSVSIIMPAYNRAELIAEAIDSVRSQTYTDWELIIIDDGSNDNTAAVVKSFLSDKRIIFHQHARNLGLAAAYNSGFSLSRAKYIAIQDSDDISLPDRIEKEVAILERYPECALVFSKAFFIDMKGQIFSEWGGDGMPKGLLSSNETFNNLYFNSKRNA